MKQAGVVTQHYLSLCQNYNNYKIIYKALTQKPNQHNLMILTMLENIITFYDFSLPFSNNISNFRVMYYVKMFEIT